MRESIFEAGRLEILRYLPPALLEDVELDTLDLDGFLTLLAQARYVEDMEIGVISRALSTVFGEE